METKSEVERKWVLPKVPAWVRQSSVDEVPCIVIEQGYLKIGELDEVRVRRWGNHFFLTKKMGNGLSRWEEEVPIDRALFEKSIKCSIGQVIKKNRFIATVNDRKFEIDEYQGELLGLVILECEFESEEEACRFLLPSGLGFEEAREVTGEFQFANKNLALEAIL